MELREIVAWLLEEDEERLEELWRRADETRRRNVGDEVHLRGLIEFSNHCARTCAYCGLRADRRDIGRYRMTADEILECAREAVRYGYGTVVLQSGEDPGVTTEWVAGLIERIKAETPLAVTLSLGERRVEELEAWRRAGADRYLLRFETSNRELYDKIHAPLAGRRSDRIALLREIGRLGYEVGSGVMIGIPGQTYEDLARDILTFRKLDLDMIGTGPFIPHPETPLGRETGKSQNPSEDAATPENTPGQGIGQNLEKDSSDAKGNGSGPIKIPQPGDQAPATEAMTYKVVALARLLCPRANIPSTTALATLNLARGRELGLERGANVVMPNMTPPRYRVQYEIYPAKACLRETAADCHQCVKGRILSIGRKIGTGPGNSPNRM